MIGIAEDEFLISYKDYPITVGSLYRLQELGKEQLRIASFSRRNGEMVYRKIKKITKLAHKPCTTLRSGAQSIRMADEQEVMMANGSFKAANQLVPMDTLALQNGFWGLLRFGESATLYAVEMEEGDNFAVTTIHRHGRVTILKSLVV